MAMVNFARGLAVDNTVTYTITLLKVKKITTLFTEWEKPIMSNYSLCTKCKKYK